MANVGLGKWLIMPMSGGLEVEDDAFSDCPTSYLFQSIGNTVGYQLWHKPDKLKDA
jgi:hypothetical protein